MKEAKHSVTVALRLGVLLLGAGALACSGGKDEKPGPGASAAPAVPERLRVFRAQISSVNVPATVKAGKEFDAQLKVRNLGDRPLPAKGGPAGEMSVHLSYHWLDGTGSTAVFDGKRSELPKDVAPAEEVVANAKILAPAKPGEYTLEVDLVQERVAWFKEHGSKTFTTDVKVEP